MFFLTETQTADQLCEHKQQIRDILSFQAAVYNYTPNPTPIITMNECNVSYASVKLSPALFGSKPLTVETL